MLRLVLDLFRAPLRFKPTEILSSISELPLLARMKHAELIIFDKDDTLTKLHQFLPASEQVATALQSLTEMKVRMMVISNSVKQGDPSFAAGIPILFTEERKPFNEGEIRRAIGSIPYERVWMVGDRLMTDIYLANKVGIRSVLVPPVEESSIEKHGLAVWGLRWLERGYISINNWR